MRDSMIQMAFREKIALCIIIAFAMFFVGFLIFGFNQLVCKSIGLNINYRELSAGSTRLFAVRGKAYDADGALKLFNGHRQIGGIAIGADQV